MDSLPPPPCLGSWPWSLPPQPLTSSPWVSVRTSLQVSLLHHSVPKMPASRTASSSGFSDCWFQELGRRTYPWGGPVEMRRKEETRCVCRWQSLILRDRHLLQGSSSPQVPITLFPHPVRPRVVTASTPAILCVPQHPSFIPSTLPTSHPSVRSPYTQFPHLNYWGKPFFCQDPDRHHASPPPLTSSFWPLREEEELPSLEGVTWDGGQRVALGVRQP